MPAGREAANRGRLILHCELVAPVRGPVAESRGFNLEHGSNPDHWRSSHRCCAKLNDPKWTH
jgi:hypothetical protein